MISRLGHFLVSDLDLRRGAIGCTTFLDHGRCWRFVLVCAARFAVAFTLRLALPWALPLALTLGIRHVFEAPASNFVDTRSARTKLSQPWTLHQGDATVAVQSKRMERASARVGPVNQCVLPQVTTCTVHPLNHQQLLVGDCVATRVTAAQLRL